MCYGNSITYGASYRHRDSRGGEIGGIGVVLVQPGHLVGGGGRVVDVHLDFNTHAITMNIL
jgi:hypothetical protein